MDPVAHTLAGAALAETGLRRTTRLATPALIVGANLPDVDAITSFVDADLMYGFRRGWTHGVLALLVLPCLLTGALWLYARLRPGSGSDPPLRVRRLLLASAIGVWSHPMLDWLNNYGVRLLMPLDGRWFYGDTIFIVDPWMWLSLASAVVLARSAGRLSQLAWSVLAVLTTWLVLTTPFVPAAARALWLAGVAGIVLARVLPALRPRAERVARGSLVALGLYVAAALSGTAVARAQARAFAAAHGATPERVIAGPIPANPFRRDVIVVSGGAYHFYLVDWLAEARVTPSHPPLPKNDGPLARAALDAPELAGFALWLRLPAFEVERHGEGHRVWIRDVRYSRIGASIGTARVDFDAAGRRTAVAFTR